MHIKFPYVLCFRFDPDEHLSELFTRLWELDDNKCYPGSSDDGCDFEINLQGNSIYRINLNP